MRRPSKRWLLLGYLGPLYIAFDYLYWHRRGGAFNHR